MNKNKVFLGGHLKKQSDQILNFIRENLYNISNVLSKQYSIQFEKKCDRNLLQRNIMGSKYLVHNLTNLVQYPGENIILFSTFYVKQSDHTM